MPWIKILLVIRGREISQEHLYICRGKGQKTVEQWGRAVRVSKEKGKEKMFALGFQLCMSSQT